MEENKNKNKNLGVRKGAWTTEEDTLLRNCIDKFGEGKWHKVPLRAGLNRCRKSCRLRWLNYLRPNLKRGCFSNEEIDLVQRLHKLLGNRWSLIAGRIPGRTANDVKNFWNTHILKKSKSSAEKNVETKALKSEKHVVIKPRPRTFSKKSSQQVNEQGGNSSNKKHASSSSSSSLIWLPDDWKKNTSTSVDEELIPFINNNNNNNAPFSLTEHEVDECIRWWLETEATPVALDDDDVFCPRQLNEKIAEFSSLAGDLNSFD